MSPVVGVMLMLVVVIIIAAVVSGFAGGLMGGTNQKAPQLAMDVHISNSGNWVGSSFTAEVTGVDSAIATQDLKLVTSWKATDLDGSIISGGATVTPGVLNTNLTYKPNRELQYGNWNFTSPQGYGPGVDYAEYRESAAASGSIPVAHTRIPRYTPVTIRADAPQYPATYPPGDWAHLTNISWFGNYALQTGTTMYARPFGYTSSPSQGGYAGSSFTVGYGTQGNKFNYTYGSQSATTAQFLDSDTDMMMAVLGNNWYKLRAGDIVNVKLVHAPSGKTIWQKEVTVEA